MAFREWFTQPSRLQLAIKSGVGLNGDLEKALCGVDDERPTTLADATAMCRAIEFVMRQTHRRPAERGLHGLAALFQRATDEAIPKLKSSGIPLLAAIVDEHLVDNSRWDQGDVIFILKILVMYGTRVGADAVIRAARLPLAPDAYMWNVALHQVSKANPQTGYLLKALSSPLPPGFLSVSLLDAGNRALLDGALIDHPFDSDEGVCSLEAWLTDQDEDRVSYANSAAVAVAFLKHPARDRLFAIALDHPSVDVQIEAAWAAARLGREAGVRCLSQYCLDVNHSDKAQRYLRELGREDAIPAAADDQDFNALSQFASWLAHPNELGRPADELEIVDSRDLDWPPERDRKSFWLIKYSVRDTTGLHEDDVGVGLVGNVTFCLFGYHLHMRPPEDAYAIHCCWELEGCKLITQKDVEEGDHEYDSLLRQWNGRPLESPRIRRVAEISPDLDYPARMVGLARAMMAGAEGWAVLDGPRSWWYADDEMPEDKHGWVPLGIHIGSVLLGFPVDRERRSYLQNGPRLRAPAEIVDRFEALIGEGQESPEQAASLLGRFSSLASAFDRYVDALVTCSRCPDRRSAVVRAYESLTKLLPIVPEAKIGEVLDNWAVLGSQFTDYVDAAAGVQRSNAIAELIARFRPHWKHALGYGVLGSAAFRIADMATAESLFLALKSTNSNWQRSEYMGQLAEVWTRTSRVSEAKSLLIDCLKSLSTESKTAKGSDKKLFEDWFQCHRSTYLRLFANEATQELQHAGIPVSTRESR